MSQPIPNNIANPYSPNSDIMHSATYVVNEIRFSVFHCKLTSYSPKDQVESAYRFKQKLTGIVHSPKEVSDRVLKFVESTLNPFLVEWHGNLFHEWCVEVESEEDLPDDVELRNTGIWDYTEDFHEDLLKLRVAVDQLRVEMEKLAKDAEIAIEEEKQKNETSN